MKYIAVIGSGRIGCRHLQGLLKYMGQLEIYVFDISVDSLKTAQQHENEVPHNHKVLYTQSWEILPEFFDLVIVASNANVRESIIFKLLENHKVRYLILEKVLFQELGAYQRVQDLLVKHNVITYVNHPRRMFQSYQDLKINIDKTSKADYNVFGSNWGLGCNALHFLDLFVYLSGKNIQDLNVNAIDHVLLESPRKGFVEFTGTLTGHLSDASFFSITSSKEEISSIIITISNDYQMFIVQEDNIPYVYYLDKMIDFSCKIKKFKKQNQSELSNNILIGLLESDFCELPTFENARRTHELFLKSMLEKYNKINISESTNLPIT